MDLEGIRRTSRALLVLGRWILVLVCGSVGREGYSVLSHWDAGIAVEAEVGAVQLPACHRKYRASRMDKDYECSNGLSAWVKCLG